MKNSSVFIDFQYYTIVELFIDDMEMISRINDESTDLIPMEECNAKTLANERLLSSGLNDNELQNIKSPKRKSTDNNKFKNRKPPGTMKLTKTKKFLIFGISWIAIIVGIVIGNLWTPLFNKILEHELVLSPTSRSFSIWKETPIPMYLKIYLFNWTNPNQINETDVKPHMNELGPYVFREVDYKVNRVWNDNGTVTFNQKRIWHFEKSMSSGSLNDIVTNLNPVALTLAYKVRHKKYTAMAVSYLLKSLNETLAVSKTVGQILFDGYDDNVLEMAKNLNISTGFASTKFGWFFGRNGSETYDGIFNMLTGSENVFDIGILQEWNYKNKSDIYPGECSAIEGTLGDSLPPLVRNDSLPVFAPDICTLIHLKYNETIDHDGLPGRRFVSTSEMFDNGTNVPARACYCKGVECQPSGTLNVSTCKYGAPAFMSLPHFYLADESYLNSIDGLKPDKDKHEFSLAIQPDLGTPLQVRGRMQLNLLLQPIENIKMYTGVPKVYMPILWFSQEANLTSSFASQIKFILIIPLLGHVTLFGIAGIGVLIFFIGICLVIRERRKTDDIQNLVSKTEENGAVDTRG